MKAYIGVVTEGVEGLLVEVARETAEGILEDVLRGLAEGGQGIVERGQGAGVLELDNVLVGDGVAIVAGDERSGLAALGGGRGTEDNRQEGEEDVQAHGEGLASGKALWRGI